MQHLTPILSNLSSFKQIYMADWNGRQVDIKNICSPWHCSTRSPCSQYRESRTRLLQPGSALPRQDSLCTTWIVFGQRQSVRGFSVSLISDPTCLHIFRSSTRIEDRSRIRRVQNLQTKEFKWLFPRNVPITRGTGLGRTHNRKKEGCLLF